jgi:hypothetical protein
MRRLSVLILWLFWATGALAEPAAEAIAASAAAPQAFVLKDTEVRTIRAKSLERDYEIYVSLPESYRAQPRRRFPVLYVSDADYAFPLVRSIAQRVGNRAQGLEEFILVGLSYGIGDSPQFSRRRDYTPTPHGEKTRDPEGRRPLFGEAEPYRRFLAEELMPFVAATYRTDTTRSLYAGHSYGGLFGLHVLLTQPSMFSHYIIGSPSLWFDRRVMFARERAFAEVNRELNAHVLMAIGSFETVNPASDDRRYSRALDMVGDFRAFEQALRGRNYPGLRLTTEVIGEEDHLTAFPAIVTRGLLWALPASRR